MLLKELFLKVWEIIRDNIKEYLTAGKLPDFSKDVNEDVLISQFLANRLKLKVGDAFNTFYERRSE
jgi:lipoprotein-releasing system permease protein